MAKGTPAQTNFNAGELSPRLHARHDLNIYNIGLAELTGWVALPEGGLDACPGTYRVAQAAGPCRLLPFEFNATQGYVIEASAGKARFYTNDARIEHAGGAPIELALPYSKSDIDALAYEQSFDVLYLFHGRHQTRQLVRVDADEFQLEPLVLENGPFEARNKDQGSIVSASGVSGAVVLTATQPIFAGGDVGGLFQLEADDFGDIVSWEPGITVTAGQLLTWNERVYRVAGGSGRTGTVAPVHGDGIEWDGIGTGTDLNDKDAGGVQLEYLCDRFGILRITGFVNSNQVNATVLRRLPFTASSSYDYEGGYYDPEWGGYVPPDTGAIYQYGTWRWRFGAFSDRRGWPTCGVLWNERLVLAKDATLYASVVGDLPNFAVRNEEGDISPDMAFQSTLADPNPISALVADDRLLAFTASGMFAIGASNQAQGVGPGNVRSDRQNNEGAAPLRPVNLDGRTLYIGKGRRRVIEGEFAAQRQRQEATDLTRYARHIGKPRFLALASQKDPNRMVWALRGDGVLAHACYVPSEQTLGWGVRRLAPGVAARSIATISDPAGEMDQLWIAAERGGAWHVLRADQFRLEDDDLDPVMTDLAAEFVAAQPVRTFGPAPWLTGAAVQVQAGEPGGEARVHTGVTVGHDGMVTLPQAARWCRFGLPFDARFTTLSISSSGDTGVGIGKMRRISRLVLDVLKTRGLTVAVQGVPARRIEELLTDSAAEAGFAPFTGIKIAEDCGEWDRQGQVTVARVAPSGATVRALQPTIDVQPR